MILLTLRYFKRSIFGSWIPPLPQILGNFLICLIPHFILGYSAHKKNPRGYFACIDLFVDIKLPMRKQVDIKLPMRKYMDIKLPLMKKEILVHVKNFYRKLFFVYSLKKETIGTCLIMIDKYTS